MNAKTKERIITAIATVIFVVMFVGMVVASAFLMRIGTAIESEMPSMQKEIQDAKDFNLAK